MISKLDPVDAASITWTGTKLEKVVWLSLAKNPFEDYGYVTKWGFDSCTAVGNALIVLYLKCNRIESAVQMFEEISKRNAGSSNTIIYGLLGLSPSIIEERSRNSARPVFDEIAVRGIVSENSMLTWYLRREKLAEALGIFEDMEEYLLQVIVLLKAAVERCISFTAGDSEAVELILTLDDTMLQYISNLQKTPKSLRSVCGVDNDVHNDGPKKDAGFEIKGAPTKDMVSEGEEWFIVQGALQILIDANCLSSRALEFEASLRTTLARIGTSLLLSSFGSTLDNPRVVATYDNGEVPLAGRASLDATTHMAYGSDPVDPQKALAPGLVYDACSQNFFEHLIHWFPIFNCLVMVMFLTGLVSIILMRTLRNECARYGHEDDDLESLERDVTEELGWKFVHGDVFQPPRSLVLLFVLVGTGAKVTLLIFIMILLAIIGNTYSLLNYLQALVEKLQITQILEGEKEGSEVLTRNIHSKQSLLLPLHHSEQHSQLMLPPLPVSSTHIILASNLC